MAQVFKVNGTALSYIVRADWLDTVVDEDLAGQTIRSRWRGHRLQTEGMSAAEYDTLYALQGQRVTLTTTNYSDRNAAYKPYYNAILLNISARHPGPIRQDVGLEFLVRT